MVNNDLHLRRLTSTTSTSLLLYFCIYYYLFEDRIHNFCSTRTEGVNHWRLENEVSSLLITNINIVSPVIFKRKNRARF